MTATEILLVLIIIMIVVLFIKRPSITFFMRIAYWIIRRNSGPEDNGAILCLHYIMKSVFKKGLSKRTYKNIKNWNLVHEFGNRYSMSFTLYEHDFSFYVIADSLGGIDIKGLDIDALEKLEKS